MFWFAVQKDRDDSDWGTGSYELGEAMAMAREGGYELIAVIEDGCDPVCVDEIVVADYD